jgi:hypothetical protein
MGRGIGSPEGFVDGADGGFVVSSGFFKARKVVGSQEELTGFVHSVKVQSGIAALPGIGPHEGVFLPVDEVGILAAFGTETGV